MEIVRVWVRIRVTDLRILVHEQAELLLLGAALDTGALLQQHAQTADPVLRQRGTSGSVESARCCTLHIWIGIPGSVPPSRQCDDASRHPT